MERKRPERTWNWTISSGIERGSISDRVKARGFEADDFLKCGDPHLQLGAREVVDKMGSMERKPEIEKVIKRENLHNGGLVLVAHN